MGGVKERGTDISFLRGREALDVMHTSTLFPRTLFMCTDFED